MAGALQDGPSISLRERDRRYAAVRERLGERGVDAVVLSGTNLFYLTNGLPGERSGVLPTRDEPIMVAINSRHLADIPASVVEESQDWVKDVRPGNDASPAIDRLKELKLEQGVIGILESEIRQAFFAQLRSALPAASFVRVDDIFLDLRTIKSDEEVAMIEQANRVFDAAIDGVFETARPGMLGVSVVQEGVRAMWAAGGDLDSSFGFNFGAVPKQNPVLVHLSMTRRIEPGDIGTLTAHAEYGHYAGHSDQEISFGEPRPLHREMFDAVTLVRDEVLKKVRAGATHEDLQKAYQAACEQTGFRPSPHSQMHQYGIDVPEFPGPSFRADGPRNFVLTPGMIYSISPTLRAPDSDDTLLGGTSLVVTETGYRDLGDRRVELLVAKG
jgi:Xaa-Pro aminopeptidase